MLCGIVSSSWNIPKYGNVMWKISGNIMYKNRQSPQNIVMDPNDVMNLFQYKDL